MRPLLATLVLLAVVGLPRAARADTARVVSPAGADATAILLLDGFRATSSKRVLGGTRASLPSGDATPGPGETLSEAVERMWSQVRAYRRPGGAEVIVRGKF